MVDARVQLITDAMARELMQAIQDHPGLRSDHEGYAVILEELDELWDEVKKKRQDRDAELMRREAIQIGAMAARFIYDLLQ